MKFFIFLCLSQTLLCTLVCGHHGGPHDDDDHDHQDHHHTEAQDFLQIAPANVKFSNKFYSHLAAAYPGDNLFFSPLSISIAFSLLSSGAKSKTLSQIREVFGFNTSLTSEETIHKGFQQLLHTINRPKSDLQMDSANALFVDNKAKLLNEFLDGAKKWYQSEAISTDFQQPKEAVKQINDYVEEKTKGKIENLLEDLDSSTSLVIVNTISFKGFWEDPFNVKYTREDDFHVDKNTVVKVPMMRRQGEYAMAFIRKMGCTVIDVPYKGNTSVIIILPNPGKLHNVEKALLNVSLDAFTKLLRPREILLSIPKFSISAELDLVKELHLLGVSEVFSDHADLSGITGESNLKVSKAVHKAVLSVDEEGTEAAAATVIGMAKMFPPPSIKVNRPFLFTILHKETSTVAFTGRIINPKK